MNNYDIAAVIAAGVIYAGFWVLLIIKSKP
jgi:hypothetical protein